MLQGWGLEGWGLGLAEPKGGAKRTFPLGGANFAANACPLKARQPEEIVTQRTEIAAIFAICYCDAAHGGPQKSLAISKTRQSNVALRFKGAMESR